MRFLKFLCIGLGGAAAMVAMLLWVSQFFNRDYDSKPLIWIERVAEPEPEHKDETFGEWQ